MPERTAFGHRRYALSRLQPGHDGEATAQKRTIAYARVSSRDQKADLERQKKILELYCARQGWTHEVIADLAATGDDCRKKLNQIKALHGP
ncbi:recombinase family protein [Haematospirillum jordaniae]|uniref:recombinase family protein n=1 Tax=Haematospirillum jordaniae TaxID=1549855 RepID=UPI001432DD3B|nr:recombinase family protein [Haematospirillum jordaniae]NKD46127.1 recombinase family protein [Haematospirillum jordaniae]NKD80832.1 recombinase family protein [Haematospirillum jordaniae]NKD83489.1 recombinase family protein [Haematospirillum jordaniae]